MAAQAELEEASRFLLPVLQPSSNPSESEVLSVVQLLASKCTLQLDPRPSRQGTVVALQAAVLLESINRALQGITRDQLENVIYSSKSRRTIDALLDLISMEGIYPYLLQGVGVPIEQRLKSTSAAHSISVERTENTLTYDVYVEKVIQSLMSCSIHGQLVVPVFNRVLADLLAILFQYGYSPVTPRTEQRNRVNEILRNVPPRNLFPVLTSLLHPSAPTWIRQPLAHALACLPMRAYGVRDTIEFLAQAHSSVSAPESRSTGSKGPVLTLETLERASKVLCSVPNLMDPEIWFREVCKQLLDLLDDQVHQLQAAASFVAGAILSRRSIGSPGTSGWKYLAAPVITIINGQANISLDQESSLATEAEQAKLNTSVSRLASILLSHPNPGLVKRLGSRVFFDLWYIICQPEKAPQCKAAATRILQSYLREMGADSVMKIVDDCCVDDMKSGDLNDVLLLVTQIERRVDTLLEVMELLDAQETASLFVQLAHKSMSVGNARHDPQRLVQEDSSSDLQQSVLLAKLMQKILAEHQQDLIMRPNEMVSLVVDILDDFVDAKLHPQDVPSVSGRNSLMSLNKQDEPFGTSVENENTGMVSIALSLLTLLATQMEPGSSEPLPMQIRLKASLQRLVSVQKVSESMRFSAQALLHQMDPAAKGKRAQNTGNSLGSTSEAEAAQHREALSLIASHLPPVRVEGLSILNALIKLSSPAIAVHPTLVLLISLLREDDEYTHLNSITTIARLAYRHPHEVLVQLTNDFADPDERWTLDVRLKLSEAIQRAIEELRGEVSFNTASHIGQGMLQVANRRKQRVKETEERKQERRQEERVRKQAQRAWDGEVPEPQEEREEITPADEAAAKILDRWAGRDKEEDMRVRASSMSVLGTLLKHALQQLGESLVHEIIDFALQVLGLEADEGANILRRAAVLLFQSLVEGADIAEERGTNMGWSLNGSILADILSALDDIMRLEPDGVALGHARTVKKTIENRQINKLELKLRGEDIRFGLDGTLRGLQVDPDKAQTGKRVIEELD